MTDHSDKLLASLNKDRTDWIKFKGLKQAGEQIKSFIYSTPSRFATNKELDNSTSIIGLAFGYGDYKEELDKNYNPNTHSPGNSNLWIAETINRLSHNKRVFAQLEVAEALRSLGEEPFFVADPRRSNKFYYSTQDVMEDMCEAGLTRGCPPAERAGNPLSPSCADSICFVSHPHHLFRARLQFLQFFKSKQPAVRVIYPDLSSIEYDPNSIQAWTRSNEAFVDREVGVCIAYHLMGRIRLPFELFD